MTWELAESGNDFITSVINGADLVPTFSAASVDDLRAEVLFLSFVICSDTCLAFKKLRFEDLLVDFPCILFA